MSLGILGEYAKSFFSSPCTGYTQILSAYSPNMFNYFPCIWRLLCVLQIVLICQILHIHLNTFRVFSKYAQIHSLSTHSPLVLITINVPLFKKLRDIIFFLRDNNFLSHFEGHFEGAKTFLTPYIVPSAARDNLGVKKVEALNFIV